METIGDWVDGQMNFIKKNHPIWVKEYGQKGADRIAETDLIMMEVKAQCLRRDFEKWKKQR